MKISTGFAAVYLIANALNLATYLPAHAWEAAENTKYYSISGKTGVELYRSVGKNGPKLSTGMRAIGLTTWDLKWRRNYQPSGNACELVDALPFVTITYTLPKPSNKLTGDLSRNWQAFSAGILAHEEVHGRLVKELAQNIINATVGLRVENDKDCKKIRDQVLARVKGEFDRYQTENRAFERREMSRGGNVHQLILALVN